VADKYGVDVSLLLGISALESSWSRSPQALNEHSPFGATPNGKTPIHYKSIADAWLAWGQQFGPRIYGVGSDAQIFTSRLELDNRHVDGPTFGPDYKGSYNSVNAKWQPEVQGLISSVRRRLPEWSGNSSQSGHSP